MLGVDVQEQITTNIFKGRAAAQVHRLAKFTGIARQQILHRRHVAAHCGDCNRSANQHRPRAQRQHLKRVLAAAHPDVDQHRNPIAHGRRDFRQECNRHHHDDAKHTHHI